MRGECFGAVGGGDDGVEVGRDGTAAPRHGRHLWCFPSRLAWRLRVHRGAYYGASIDRKAAEPGLGLLRCVLHREGWHWWRAFYGEGREGSHWRCGLRWRCALHIVLWPGGSDAEDGYRRSKHGCWSMWIFRLRRLVCVCVRVGFLYQTRVPGRTRLLCFVFFVISYKFGE